MWLNDCTPEEHHTLLAIAALAASLPRAVIEYAGALSDINRKFFDKPTHRRPKDLNPLPGSMSLTHQVAASPRYGT